MIGGKDILIPTTAGPASLDFAVRAIGRCWGSAVFEDAQTGREFEKYASVPFGAVRELLAYKDKLAAERWRELGADDSLNGTMIHVLLQAAGLTLVVDSNPSAEVSLLVTMIQHGLTRGAFAQLHRRPAA